MLQDVNFIGSVRCIILLDNKFDREKILIVNIKKILKASW